MRKRSELAVQERICPSCGRSNWSANTHLGGIWYCWNCNASIGPECVVEEPPPVEEIPEVNPDSDTLDDLFAWGEAVARRAGLTEERSRELLRLVREYLRKEGEK